MLKFEYPSMLYALLALIPAWAIIIMRLRSFVASLDNLSAPKKGSKNGFKNSERKTADKPAQKSAGAVQALQKRVIFRSILWSFAFAFLVTAAASPSWGTKLEPVQINGNAAAFVFDVSYSMNAADMPYGSTRLAASAQYADALLSRMSGATVSVVLVKGSAMLAIPQTDDFSVIRSLLGNLSPMLLTSAGSNIGSGIETALRSFAKNTSSSSAVVLFTDGDETIESLKLAVEDALSQNVPVYIVGFGSTKETEILTGDGERTAKTALREDALKELCDDVTKQIKRRHGDSFNAKAVYVNALNMGSALTVLDGVLFSNEKTQSGSLTLYESKPVRRQSLFAFLALVFFGAGLCVMQINPKRPSAKIAGIMLCALMFTSCSSQKKSAMDILKGVIHWVQEDYQEASADFLEAKETAVQQQDETAKVYAQYGIAVSYLMLNEKEAALNQLEKLVGNDVPALVRFGALYNSGIVSYQKGDFKQAADFFKQALLVDNSQLDAKINLELAMSQAEVHTKVAQSELQPVHHSEGSSAQDTVFSMMKENDDKHWKSEKQEKSDILDY